MGLSRRQFSKEFKLAAVRRLEQGASRAEVARTLEVSPNVLDRWRSEHRKGTRKRFSPAWASRACRTVRGSLSWNARSANRHWRLIF